MQNLDFPPYMLIRRQPPEDQCAVSGARLPRRSENAPDGEFCEHSGVRLRKVERKG